MSYILDALRKSDQLRRRGTVPTLHAAPVAALAAEQPAFLFYGLLGMALIAIGMSIAWLRPWRSEPPVIVPFAATPLESPRRQAAPPATAVAKAESEPPRPALPSAAPATIEVAAPAPKQKLPASAKAGKHSLPPVAVATPEGRAGKPSAEDMAQQKPTANSDLPLAIPRGLPPISVAVHAYSSTPRDRLVSVNGRMLREGDTLAPDLKLEQITPDGMIFSYRGYRFRRAAQ